MVRTIARIAGIAILAVGVLTPAAAAPHKSSGTGSKACNDGTVTWSPTTLWPPNHKMQTINIGYTDNDNDGDMIGVMVGSISDNQAASDGSNELKGSGQPTDKQGLDWSGTGNMGTSTDPGTASTTAQVRAERSGTSKDGRTYTINVTCSDMGGSNNEMEMQTVQITVFVPHDQGHR
jgi:hypothetical protein